MSEPTTAQEALGTFLRNLRQETWDELNVTQVQLARALGASPALVSSWESAGAIPPEDRLRQYARFFCTHRSVETKPAALIPSDDLNSEEEREREALIDKLVRLREEALHRPKSLRRETGTLGGRFWYFPDGQPVTIFCTPMSVRQILGPGGADAPVDDSLTPMQQYALNPTHPNYVRNFNNGDIDALVELVGHIRAENPTIDIQWKTSDAVDSANDFTGHTVILGSGDSLLDDPSRVGNVVEDFLRLLDLPVQVGEVPEGDEEFDLQFVVRQDEDGVPMRDGTRRETYGPRFRRNEEKAERPRLIESGAPILDYDVALLVRKANPLNASATLTMCTGLFSRGTYGAVRAFTDANLRARNEQYLSEVVSPSNFWMLIQVPVFGGDRTVTPDLGRPFLRLSTS